MSLVFKTPQSTLNTTTGLGQNIGSGCPECPECPEVDLTTGSAEYTENGEYTLTPEGDGFSSVDVTVNVDVTTPYNNGVAAGEAAQKAKLESATFVSNGTYTKEDGYNSVTVNVPSDINNQEKNATPTTSSQEIVADNGYSGLSKVTISGVTSAIDSNITAGNIKEGVTILGVTGTVDPTPDLQAKNVTPTTSQQVIEADSPNYGLSSVTVAGVTSAIDSNISAGNIKKDVAILGVTGTYDPQPTLQDKTVAPTTSQQVISADNGYDGLDEVTVGAVTSAIDQNIVAGNIKSGVTILGVQGTVQEGITPTGNINITDTSSTNVTNYATAQVVDANLVASNIKNGVSILGVSGSYDPQPDLETKTVTYTANNTYTITPTAGKDGISQATVTVNVPTSGATIETGATYTVDVIGTHTIEPSSGYDGMDSVELTVEYDPYGSFGNPFGNYTVMLETDFNEGYYYSDITSGEINETTGYYDAESDLGEVLHIKPYISDGGDPETYSFPEDFDLIGKGVVVRFSKENATPVTDEISDDVIGVDINECELISINGNTNPETWLSSNCPDWSSIGWNCTDVTASGIDADLAVTADLLDDYTDDYAHILYFHNKTNMVYAPSINVKNFNLTVGTFENCSNLIYVPKLTFRSGNVVGGVTPFVSAHRMFSGCKSLPHIDLDLIDSGNGSASNGYVQGASSMFNNCTSLRSATLRNTNGFTDTGNMFSGCSSLTDVSLFDTSNVTNMYNMFGGCTSLTSIPVLDTSSVVNLSSFANGCRSLISFPQLNTSNVVTFDSCFSNCVGLTSIPQLN